MPVPKGYVTTFLGETFYKIENFDEIPPFFMTIVSASDIWNFVWSNGGVTCGRKDPDRAIFPYYTADKISDCRFVTGPYTAIRLIQENFPGKKESSSFPLWEPLREDKSSNFDIERNIYKNTSSSKIYFEEVNNTLGFKFQYGWLSSHRFGIVRHVRILNLEKGPKYIEVLDGCQNILPACINSELQNEFSILLDAYKKTDLEQETGIAIFGLSSIVTDRAEPSEGLMANVGWFSNTKKVYLHPDTIKAFKENRELPTDSCIKGLRPSLFILEKIELGSEEVVEWYQVFNTWLDATAIVDLVEILKDRKIAKNMLEDDIKRGEERLNAYIYSADGHQDGGDLLACIHHKENVLFNIMRGGIFYNDYNVPIWDVLDFIKTRNKGVYKTAQKLLEGLPEEINYYNLLEIAEKSKEPHFERLCLEYLPLTFSRRHGDPSRPWNRFSIDIQDEHGNPRLNYQGNWRDIFQNWEALAYSYPGYAISMVAKFLNAITIDGYNPYRIMRDGIDWEVLEPDNPWSHIGYWGDHQVIYLLKLLELLYNTQPELLHKFLDKAVFSTANVPYRIKSYKEILQNPRETIDFDKDRHTNVMKKISEYGTDARLVLDSHGKVALVTMTAKLITILCAKMANYIPDGGIWLNTQRPEWNDANNALAGWGLSMVTLYYLHRYLTFMDNLYRNSPINEYTIPVEVGELFTNLVESYKSESPEKLGDPIARRKFVDRNEGYYEKARRALYEHGFSRGNSVLSSEKLIDGFQAFLNHIRHAILKNKRSDGLYHSYNILNLDSKGGMHIEYLDEMLEGQVAVLSSMFLSEMDALELCRKLRQSRLFREDQYSYQLYPEKELPHFLEKNRIMPEDYQRIPLLVEMIKRDDKRIISVDRNKVGHFHASFRNVSYLEKMLDDIESSGSYDVELIRQSRSAILSLYEKIFNHKTFTGRSGTFYAYEGIGSIYWHMVSKLLLAVQEQAQKAQDPSIKQALIEAYYDVRQGLSFNKTPSKYGAFPIDPYSHTPAGQGARQPGMTGQVKEEILTRWGELGLEYSQGRLFIKPRLLRRSEFDSKGEFRFTFCGVPFIYKINKQEMLNEELVIQIKTSNEVRERKVSSENILCLTPQETLSLIYRDKTILEIRVHLPETYLYLRT